MDVRFVSDNGIQQHPVGELERLLARDHGFVWVDIPVCDEEAARVLSEVFGFHPLAIQACIERNAVPKVRAYRDHVFVVQHAPELGEGGHVHYVELDQFIGARFVVTVHGPVNPAVPPEAAARETRAVLGGSRRDGCAPGRRLRCPMRSSRPWRKAKRRLWRRSPARCADFPLEAGHLP
jgi:magnesium transporter